jgi:hypothetical protein
VVILPLTAGDRSTVVRYCYSIDEWTSVCREGGFEVDEVRELSVPPASLSRWYSGDDLEAMSESAQRFPCTLLVCARKSA